MFISTTMKSLENPDRIPPGSFMMEEDRMGMRVQSETVEINKDDKGLVGITIGGGHPFCPCVYVVQVFDGSPAAADGRIRCGDEVVAINGINVKGEKKNNVASLIQCSSNPVKITVNKLEADPSKGKTMDIILKKVKHKVVEFMDQDSADALGLSRAILCNDPLLKKMKVLEDNADLYRNLISYFNELIQNQEKINEYQKVFGDVFCELAAHEAQANANEAFNVFGDAHRLLEKRQNDAVRQLKPIVNDLVTYVDKVIPDTQLTVKKYLDIKYEYLSYCLKIKELDDEEMEFHTLDEGLYRVETGNYEYRLMLRCRQDARQRFVQMRNDVMVKIELLDQKHGGLLDNVFNNISVRDIANHLTNHANVLKSCQADCVAILQKTVNTPIEIDLVPLNTRISGLSTQDSAELEETEPTPPVQEELLVFDEEVPSTTHNGSPNLLDLDQFSAGDTPSLIDIN